MAETSNGGEDPNEEYDDKRARGEDPKLANLSEAQVKEKLTEAVPFKVGDATAK